MQASATTRPGSFLLAEVISHPSMEAHRIQVPAKAGLYQPDDLARSVHYIHSGQVRTFQVAPNRSRRLVEILGPEEWCGVAAIAGLDRYGELAEAVGPTVVSIVPADRLMERLAGEPGLAIELLRQLARKLTTVRDDAANLVFEDCHHRLVRTLVHLSESPAASRTTEGVIVHITHQQLAQKVGVARETVSLALAQLRRRNVLRTGRNQLAFSPEALRQLHAGNGEG